MFENMAGAVGFAMHDDWLARAAKNIRLVEAERAARSKRDAQQFVLSIHIAKALTALAARLDANVMPVGERRAATAR